MTADDDTRIGWVTDPGHGWLRVPLADVAGFRPSQYSHRDDRFAYLEEAVDAAGWVEFTGRKADADAAPEIGFTSPTSPVRLLPRFPGDDDGPCLCGDLAHADCRAGACVLRTPAEATS